MGLLPPALGDEIEAQTHLGRSLSHRRPVTNASRARLIGRRTVDGSAPAATTALSVLVLDCQSVGLPQSAAQLCAEEARAYNGTVAAAFDTNVGAVRALEPLAAEPSRWPALPESHAAALCYIDGEIAKSPPGGNPFDRAVIAIVDRGAPLIAAGYRDRVPVRPP